MRIAFITNEITGTCGVSIYSRHLLRSLKSACPNLDVVVVNVSDALGGDQGDDSIVINRNRPGDYAHAGDRLRQMRFDVACLQHEYGLFGGDAGSYILQLIQHAQLPLVCTLHTILKYPDPAQAMVLEAIAHHVTKLVSLSAIGAEFLVSEYGIPPSSIAVVPHGVPTLSQVQEHPTQLDQLLDGRFVLLTFGLLSPNKRIETVLHALSRLVFAFPNLLYLVAGQTHPNVLRSRGEAYRESLGALAKDLGVEPNFIMHDAFLEEETLARLLRRADVYIAPGAGPEQIVSGTLSYALAAARSIIATRTWYAEELLSPDAGVLVEHDDIQGMTEAIRLVATEPAMRASLSAAAQYRALGMGWEAVADQYLNLLDETCRATAPGITTPVATRSPNNPGHAFESLPPLNLDHFRNLIDDTGIVQHCRYLIPDYTHGYCTDDVARALIVTTQLQDSRALEAGEGKLLVWRFLGFLSHAWNPSEKRIRNFLSYDRRWLEDVGSECSHGRTVWALGTVASISSDRHIINAARMLFSDVLQGVASLSELRALAFSMLGAGAYLGRFPNDHGARDMLEETCAQLLAAFEREHHRDWLWFEEALTYFNARIPQALLVAGKLGTNAKAIEVALSTLEWLAEKQMTPDGLYCPIGNRGFWRRGTEMPCFEQQPVEACSMVGACHEAYAVTRSDKWVDLARSTLEWFHG